QAESNQNCTNKKPTWSRQSAWEHQAIRRLVLRFHCVPWRGVAQEFQATLVSCFLRDSHSEPVRTRGATSIKRGISLKTLEAVQGWPSRVRYSRALRASAMLRKEMSWTIISARNLRVCISRGSSSKWRQS